MNVSLTPQSEAIISKYTAQGYSVEEIIEQALRGAMRFCEVDPKIGDR